MIKDNIFEENVEILPIEIKSNKIIVIKDNKIINE